MPANIAIRIFIAFIVLGCFGIALLVLPVLFVVAVGGVAFLAILFIYGLFFAKRL